VFCQEEDAAKRKRRRKANGGSGSKRYVEGWVEFADKKVAKRVAAALHQHPISTIKRNPHYGDLWNLKYLSKFQWSHLTEKVAYERRVREQKLRLETMQAKRESASYKKLLETGVKLDQIAERKRKRDGSATADDKDAKKTSSFQIKPLHEGAHQASNAAILKSLL
jgi:ESF2/ABP1 family protein